MILQRDRKYNLIITQSAGAKVEINNLHIEFDVTKYADNKKKPNKARISIYNLPAEYQRYVEVPFVECALEVGYLTTGVQQLFSGQVTIAGTRKQGADIVTTLELDSLFTQINHKIVSKTVAPGRSVQEVIMAVAASVPEVKKSVFSGDSIKNKVIDGYPMMGTPKQILTELAYAYNFEWQIDGQTLYINDIGGSFTQNKRDVVLISETTGLIERPYYDNIERARGKGDKRKKARRGVELSILLNPAVTAGSTIKIDYGDFSGYYKVEAITSSGSFYGNEWTSKLKCSTIKI